MEEKKSLRKAAFPLARRKKGLALLLILLFGMSLTLPLFVEAHAEGENEKGITVDKYTDSRLLPTPLQYKQNNYQENPPFSPWPGFSIPSIEDFKKWADFVKNEVGKLIDWTKVNILGGKLFDNMDPLGRLFAGLGLVVVGVGLVALAVGLAPIEGAAAAAILIGAAIGGVGALAAGLLSGDLKPVDLLFGTLGGALLGGAGGWLGGLIGRAGGLLPFLRSSGTLIGGFVSRAGSFMGSLFSRAGSAIMNGLSRAGGAMMNGLSRFGSGVWGILAQAGSKFMRLGHTVMNAAGSAWNAMGGASGLLKTLSKYAKTATLYGTISGGITGGLSALGGASWEEFLKEGIIGFVSGAAGGIAGKAIFSRFAAKASPLLRRFGIGAAGQVVDGTVSYAVETKMRNKSIHRGELATVVALSLLFSNFTHAIPLSNQTDPFAKDSTRQIVVQSEQNVANETTQKAGQQVAAEPSTKAATETASSANTPLDLRQLYTEGNGDSYNLLKRYGIPTTFTEDEMKAAKSVDLRMQYIGTKETAAVQEASKGTGDVGQYTQKIKWGIQDVEVRPAGKGFFGQRTQQINPRVDAYELKINPNNESYYLKSPAGGYVQYENMVNDVVMDGKLVLQQKSFYHVNDLPDFARNKVLQEAMRQVEAANNVRYTVEWLISDPKAVAQLTDFFKSKSINIVVKYFPE